MKLPGVGHRAAGAVDVPLPGRRELLGDAAPHRVGASTSCAPPTPAARSCACRTPTRSRPPSPTPSAPTSTCSSASSSARARSASLVFTSGGPAVLAVNSTGGSLKELRPVVSAPERSSSSTRSTRSPRRRSASPGSRVFYLHARAGQQRVTVKCEKQQVTAIAQYLRRVLSDLPPPEDRPLPFDLREPGEQSFVLGPIGLGYDRGNDRLLVQLEELVPTAARRRGRRGRGRRRRRRRRTAGTSGCTSRAARPPRSASTPTSWSPPAARTASGAATPSTPTVIRARG